MMEEMIKKQLEKWHDVVFNKNMAGLEEMLSDDIVFYSPALWKPKTTKIEAIAILSTVIEVFDGFTYHRELTPDRRWALEFSAKVGDKGIKGIDLIEFNEDWKINKFEVFIRPLTGLIALAETMGQRLKEKGYI